LRRLGNHRRSEYAQDWHGNIGLLDALFERSGDIKTISVHHETVAGFMADVYYRIAGRARQTADRACQCVPGLA